MQTTVQTNSSSDNCLILIWSQGYWLLDLMLTLFTKLFALRVGIEGLEPSRHFHSISLWSWRVYHSTIFPFDCTIPWNRTKLFCVSTQQLMCPHHLMTAFLLSRPITLDRYQFGILYTPTVPYGSGGSRVRTGDPNIANVVLYQLSYTPK